MKNRRKAVQPFEIKKRKIDISRNYEANGFEKNQRKFENFSTLISKKSKPIQNFLSIRSGFLSFKALGREDNQGRKRVQNGSNSIKNYSVSRSEKVKFNFRFIRTKCVVEAFRPHIGAADTDINDIGDSIA